MLPNGLVADVVSAPAVPVDNSDTAGVLNGYAALFGALGALVVAVSVLIPVMVNARRMLAGLAEVRVTVRDSVGSLTASQDALVGALEDAARRGTPDPTGEPIRPAVPTHHGTAGGPLSRPELDDA